MAIMQFKNADGNWESFVDYDMLVEIQAGVNELLERSSNNGGSCDHHIIEYGIYKFVDNPQTGVVSANPNYGYSYLTQDIHLYNTTKLSRGYSITVPQNKIILGSAEVSFTLIPEQGTVIYENGAWADDYSQQYKVTVPMVVSEEFYNWWNANTTKVS